MADLTLYGSLSGSRSWWVAWMCQELGIAFDNEHAEGFLDPSWKSPEYLAVNPSGLVGRVSQSDGKVAGALSVRVRW